MTSRFLSKLLAAGAASLALAAAGSAHAGTYELNFIGTDVAGDVFATTTGTGSSQTVTSIAGWVSYAEVGSGIFNVTGLSSYAGATNLFYLASPYVDFGGLSFWTDAGGEFNLGLGGSNATGLVLNASAINPGGYAGGVDGSTNIVMTATAVPEPASLAMVMAGALGLFGLTRRRGAR
jgi:hypothetical protein